MKFPLMLLVAVALSGCRYEVLDPQGWVAIEERNLLLISTAIMLIVIVPVLVLAVYFPWKYRADRDDTSDYDPNFSHSTKLELAVWGVPIGIVIALGAYTWIYTHRLDPYRPLDVAGKPVEVEAVSLDWKWLFIYPQYGIASVNELAIPAGRPVAMRLTSSSMMNTFSVPALAGMVYSMAAMETKLHFIADRPGTYPGRSAHFSGPGFADMTFDARAMSDGDFDAWVAKAKAGGGELSRKAYLHLEKPSMAVPVRTYGTVAAGLFDRIRDLCVEDGKVCVSQMMRLDMMGGGGLKGIKDKKKYEYDNERAIDGFGRPLKSDVVSGIVPREPVKVSALETADRSRKEPTHGN